MNYMSENAGEPRFTEERRQILTRRSGVERRTKSQRLADERRANDRRANDRREGDRRKVCMHCGSPYKLEITGTRACTCRVTALRGTP